MTSLALTILNIMPSYYTRNFGCRANQADGAAIEQDLAARGYTAAGDHRRAAVVILNSCTVTGQADADLRQAARRIHRENPQARIVITGCYAQRRPEELAALPGVEWVIGNAHKAEIAGVLEAEQTREAKQAQENFGASHQFAASHPSTAPSASFFPITQLSAHHPDDDEAPLGAVKRARILTSDIHAQRQFTAAPFFGGTVEDRTRPNLKIQDGCNNRCSFCIIPSVRGLSRSLAPAEVIGQVRSLADAGYREVVISGVNLGQYGRDLWPRLSFVRLLRRVLDETGIEKLRLSSVEPVDFTDTLLDLMASTPRIARHIHAPLQSGSDRILRLMHRKYTAARYRQRILAAFARFPNAAFGADVIVGFPGETDEDFAKTHALVDELPMTYLHVFPYSRRPGTPADQMRDQVPPQVIRERARQLRDLSARKNIEFRERQVGKILPAITLDEITHQGSQALSDNYIQIQLSQPARANAHIRARVTGTTQAGLHAQAL